MLNYRQEKSHLAGWLILESLKVKALTIKLEILHKNHITIFLHFKTNHAITQKLSFECLDSRCFLDIQQPSRYKVRRKRQPARAEE